MRTEAKANGYYSLPSIYSNAEILANRGIWDWYTLQMTPYWLMQRVRFIWELDALCKEKQNNDLERETRAAGRH